MGTKVFFCFFLRNLLLERLSYLLWSLLGTTGCDIGVGHCNGGKRSRISTSRTEGYYLMSARGTYW